MTLIHADCIEAMAAMEPDSVDAIVTDPPYGLEFMGKEWDRLGPTGWGRGGFGVRDGTTWPSYGASASANASCAKCGGRQRGAKRCDCAEPDWRVKGTTPEDASLRLRQSNGARMQAWHEAWAREAFRVAKPSAYLLAFGGTRTVHRLASAIEDAGWIIRDTLVWAYASGFPKSKASLKPAWEPIVMARKPGPLRMLAIDECRIPLAGPGDHEFMASRMPAWNRKAEWDGPAAINPGPRSEEPPEGRWPANVILTDPIFDGGWDGVVGGGEQDSGPSHVRRGNGIGYESTALGDVTVVPGGSGTYSRFFLIPKADRADREPVLGGLPSRVVNITEGHGLGPVNTSKGDGTGIRENRPRSNVHPTVKPVDLMRHLVRLVTPTGGTVLDPFLGSGTTALAAEMEGFPWIGIEREAEYVAIAEARLNGTQRGLGLGA